MVPVSTRWAQLKQRIFLRKVPHAIFSWRYCLPGQPAYVKAHRKVFLNTWPSKPRSWWVLVAVYSYLLWFAYQGWRQVWVAWSKHSSALLRSSQISKFRQLGDLLSLAFLQTTPPFYYYLFRLNRYPARQWLRFVYSHELPHWHLTFSPAISGQSADLMSDKDAFAKAMSKCRIPAIDGVLVKPGEPLEMAQVFQRRSLFFKPQRGSQKQGCMVLHYDAAADEYGLEAQEGRLTAPDKILACLRDIVDSTPYLIQPLLENHPQLLEAVPCEQLLTFRVVTICQQEVPKVVSCLLEWSEEPHAKVVYPITFNVTSGHLSLVPIPNLQDNAHQVVQPILLRDSLPIGRELAQTAEAAHQAFPDIFAIGWDLVWTPSGVHVLEGNINWGVDAHQLQEPTLIEYYADRVTRTM